MGLFLGNKLVSPAHLIKEGGGEFQLTRVKDDNGNEIGTYYMDFVDGSNNSYKVIVLDAQYRNTSTQWCSNANSIVTNLPIYNGNLITGNPYTAKETATFNTQKILDFCSSNGYTSSACSHCRSQSFTINGVIYYGQLPNLYEVMEIMYNYNNIEALDITASSYTTKNFSNARSLLSSNQMSTNHCFYLPPFENVTHYSYKDTSGKFACPILEIPNN